MTEMRLEEMELVRAAGKGDHRAFRILVERYQGRVAATVINMLGPGPESEDVGQDAFIRLYQALPNFRGDASVGTYVTRIAMNLSLNEIRRRKRKSLFGLTRFSGDEESDKTVASLTGDSETSSLEFQVRMRALVLRLGPDHRAVVVLRWMEGYSTEETAELLGIPKGTVLSRLHRAMQEMRGWLEASKEEKHAG